MNKVVGLYYKRHFLSYAVARVASPSRPEITPVSDTSVLVQWTVPPPSASLTIVTFKLQYRDVLERTAVLGWQTVDDDIPASARSFEVTRLRPGASQFCGILSLWRCFGTTSPRFVLLFVPLSALFQYSL